jgi:hypothetical protein
VKVSVVLSQVTGYTIASWWLVLKKLNIARIVVESCERGGRSNVLNVTRVGTMKNEAFNMAFDTDGNSRWSM